MNPALQGALELLLLTALGAATFAIKRWIDENSKKTDAATAAATDAKAAAESAEASAKAAQVAQVDSGELTYLRQFKAAVETLPECDACLPAVRALTERRRLVSVRKADPPALRPDWRVWGLGAAIGAALLGGAVALGRKTR